MPYFDTPLATSRIKDTQQPIRLNFQEIQTSISEDHIPLGSPDTGKHTALHLTQVGDPTTSATELGFYQKNGTGGAPQIFIRRQSNGTIYNFTEVVAITNGQYTFLPNGLVMVWGFTNANGETSITLTGAPGMATFQSISITPDKTGGSNNIAAHLVNVTPGSPPQITVYGGERTTTSTTNVSFRFIMIYTPS